MTPLKAMLSFQKIPQNLGALSAPEGSALVLGTALAPGESPKAVVPKAAAGAKELDAAYKLLLSFGENAGKNGDILTLLEHTETLGGLKSYKHLVRFGVGKTSDCHPQNILVWGAKVAKELNRYKLKNADIWIDSLYHAAGSAKSPDAPKDFANRPALSGIPTREDFLEKFAIGMYLGLYTFDQYKSKKKDKKDEKSEPLNFRFLSKLIDGAKAKQILAKAQTLAEAVYYCRDLQTTPSCDLKPADLARAAEQAGKAAGFSTTIFDEKKLKSEGMNGILAVGQGSEAPPRFIIMEHNASKKNVPTIVLVGKGVTFDTGGISIKPAAGMEEMKMDMSGAASVVGAMIALAKLKAPVHAVGLIASAENMPSGSAQNPGDVYTAYDGQTVEVINTDAEGRLVLADALAYAKKYEPDCVIDVATLTGAVVIALGSVASGIMGNNADLINGFRRASDKAGERTWELPLYPEYGEDMRSKVADYRNSSNNREAGSEKGGAFLNFFVGNAYPWIHLDVAATADTGKGQGDHCPPDVGTGVPVRALVEFAMNVGDYFKV